MLEAFFKEFMELFFPEAAEAIDFRHVRFLPQEVFAEIGAGKKYRIDLLVETRLKEEPGLILVHVEPQAYKEKNFGERMFTYFSRLHQKYRRRILPVAVFTYDKIKEEPDTYSLGFSFLEVLRFRFYKLELRKLPWREFIKKDNPVAAAFLCKMGFNEKERVQVKIEFMRMISRLEIDPARMELIVSFFETYLRLSKEEEQEFYTGIGKLEEKEAEKIMQITTSWYQKGHKEGLLKGRREGRKEGWLKGKEEGWLKGREEGWLKGKQEVLLKVLRQRFGLDNAALEGAVLALQDASLLDDLLLELLSVSTAPEAEQVVLRAAARCEAKAEG